MKKDWQRPVHDAGRWNGMNTFRLPIRWERLQQSVGPPKRCGQGPLPAAPKSVSAEEDEMVLRDKE